MTEQSCSLGCSCKRHLGGFKGTPGRGRSCEQDCDCQRHNNPKLLGSKPCVQGCSCRRHIPTKGTTGMPAWNKGLTKETDERVAQYARNVQEHIETCDGGCGGAACGNRDNPSQLQWRVYDLLLQDFDTVIPEARFGPYSVDFLLADEWLGIEVDGTYWHKVNDTDYDARDRYLLENFGLPVVRLSEEEIKELDL